MHWFKTIILFSYRTILESIRQFSLSNISLSYYRLSKN